MAKSYAVGSSTTTRTWSGSRARTPPICSSSSMKSCTSPKSSKSAPRDNFLHRLSVFPQSGLLPEIVAIAREAGALLMDYFRRRVVIEYKGDVDLVTEADRNSEKLIVERIKKRWPEHDIIGEEGTRTQ